MNFSSPSWNVILGNSRSWLALEVVETTKELLSLAYGAEASLIGIHLYRIEQTRGAVAGLLSHSDLHASTETGCDKARSRCAPPGSPRAGATLAA